MNCARKGHKKTAASPLQGGAIDCSKVVYTPSPRSTVLFYGFKCIFVKAVMKIDAKMKETWRQGLSDTEYEHIELGLAEGAVEISPMTHTDSIKHGNYTFRNVTQSRWAHIQDISDKIKTDQLIVSDSSSKYEEVNISATTTTEPITQLSISTTPGMKVTILLLGLSVLITLRKHRKKIL